LHAKECARLSDQAARARVSVEAGIAQTLYKEFGIAAKHVVTAAKASLARVRAR
jgi:hypothetical protein